MYEIGIMGNIHEPNPQLDSTLLIFSFSVLKAKKEAEALVQVIPDDQDAEMAEEN